MEVGEMYFFIQTSHREHCPPPWDTKLLETSGQSSEHEIDWDKLVDIVCAIQIHQEIEKNHPCVNTTVTPLPSTTLKALHYHHPFTTNTL